ncbi:MAG: hypothetical protein AB8B80_11745 [Marinicellaceae bacterium]
MKKLLLALTASLTITSAIAQTTIDQSVAKAPAFELKKADFNSTFLGQTLTPRQICIRACLATYGTWNDRGLDRCLADCGVQMQ